MTGASEVPYAGRILSRYVKIDIENSWILGSWVVKNSQRSFKKKPAAECCKVMDPKIGCLLVLQDNEEFVFGSRSHFRCSSVCVCMCVHAWENAVIIAPETFDNSKSLYDFDEKLL